MTSVMTSFMLNHDKSWKIKESVADYKEGVKNIRTELKEYLVKYQLKSLVIGVSGGIDSALCCALAKPVCDELGVNLIGRSIAIESNKPDEVRRAQEIMESFCSIYKDVDLTLLYQRIAMKFGDAVIPGESETARKIRRGNLKARLRMMMLYDMAQANNGLVLSTDNYTEYLLGFWTLHGDVGDYGMIQSLWKTEVYNMSQYIVDYELEENPKAASALQECIDCVATDGLGITSSDVEQLGVETYEEVDQILLKYCLADSKHEGISLESPIVKRHMASQFKRLNPYNIDREEIFSE